MRDDVNEVAPTLVYPDQVDLCGDSGTHSWRREITKRFRLPPGYYAIVANNFYEDRNCRLLLRIYTQSEITTR
jgi:hypothetical protein